MYYFKMKTTKWIVALMTFSPIKADGSRDITCIQEIGKFDDAGNAMIFRDKCNEMMDRLNTGDTIRHMVISTREAKQWEATV